MWEWCRDDLGGEVQVVNWIREFHDHDGEKDYNSGTAYDGISVERPTGIGRTEVQPWTDSAEPDN